MFPTQTKLKLIPILEFTCQVLFKKGMILFYLYENGEVVKKITH